MSKKSSARFSVGKVHCHQLGLDRWKIRYRDPASGRDVQRMMNGNKESLMESAIHIASQIMAKDGYIPGQKPKAPDIRNGILEAIELANTRPDTTSERTRRANRFIEWLAEVYPAVKSWEAIRPAMVQRYVNQLESERKAYDSVRLDIAPVKLAWRVMAENYPELVRPLGRIKLAQAPRRKLECLTSDELAKLLDWIRVNASDLYPMACLQGLAGLRVLEASALRYQDIDLEAGTVTVTDTGQHAPKTRESYRTLPVCSTVLEALRHAMACQKVAPVTGELFVNANGSPWNRTALGHRWTKKLRKAAAQLDNPRYQKIPCKRLRSAFATIVDSLNAPERLLKAYLGHTSGDMLGSHYRVITLDDLKAISSVMESWKDAPNGRKLETSGEDAI